MRPLVLAALLAGCGVVVANPDDAGRHADAVPAADDAEPDEDAGDEEDSGDPIDIGGGEDALPMDATAPDAGVTHMLHVNVVGPGRVQSTPSGIDCGSACDSEFLVGTLVELTAYPDRNARVASWSSPCTGAGESCGFTPVDNTSVSVSFEIRPPIVQTGQAADLVLGQPDFLTTEIQTLNGSAMTFPTTCSSFGSRLWITDLSNHRLLQWDSEPFLNQAAATEALGQPNLISNSSETRDADTFFTQDSASDGQRLFVMDGPRILVFDPIPNVSGRAASLVFGQPDFTTINPSVPTDTQAGGDGISISGGRMFAAQSNFHRVLIWNSIPTTSGLHPADVVLGQPDFTTVTVANPPTASSLRSPRDVFHDPVTGKLVVVDNGNNRLLIWNVVPSANAAPADIVVGQSDFAGRLVNAGGAAPNEFGFSDPRAATIAHDALFVADFFNQRVLVWQPVPALSTEPASFVLGRNAFNETEDADPGPATVGFAHGVCVLGTSLYVTNSNWNRTTRYELNP